MKPDMAAKGARDWAQLDAFEAEYAERLANEKKQENQSQFLAFLKKAAQVKSWDEFYADELKGRDEQTRRLFALRGKIQTLREKLGLPDEDPLPIETQYLPAAQTKAEKPKRSKGPRFVADTTPPGFFFPVTFDEIRAVLAELPPEHTEPLHEIRLSNQKKTGADGDWLDGEIRLHCLIASAEPFANGTEAVRRLMGRAETGADVTRWGGDFEWEGNKLYAVWPLDAYKTFVLRRVLVHEVAHGVAEMPGYSAKVKQAGSVERFCEQYAEAFYKPPGKSVRLGF